MIAKLINYAHKYQGTKTQGEDARREQNAAWVEEVIHQRDELYAILRQPQFQEIARFVKFVVEE